MKLGILKSFSRIQPLVNQYIASCKELKIDYVVINLLSDNWIKELIKSNVDGVLVRVMGNTAEHKSFFDEKLFIISEELKIPIYPSKKELYLYENKRLYEYWLTANNFPHPKTWVFYNKKQALNFLNKAKYPLVFKTNGGAGSSGVYIIKNKMKAKLYAHQVFGFIDYRLSFGKIHWKRYGLPVPKFGTTQRHYLIVQEFLDIKWEWRIIKIGKSYSGYQKLLEGNYASGSGKYGWVDPPKELLLLVKNLCEKGNFDSMAMDVMETKNGEFYINELQSLFGSITPYQMKINNIPGRYLYENGDFIFEEGIFNRHGSNLLRVKDFVEKINSGYYKEKI